MQRQAQQHHVLKLLSAPSAPSPDTWKFEAQLYNVRVAYTLILTLNRYTSGKSISYIATVLSYVAPVNYVPLAQDSVVRCSAK